MGIELPGGDSGRLGSDNSTDTEEERAEDLKALRNGEYDFDGLADLAKRHVLDFLWNEKSMSVEEISELINVRENIVEPSLRYHGLKEGARPSWPPWKRRPHRDRVHTASKSRKNGGESGRYQQF